MFWICPNCDNLPIPDWKAHGSEYYECSRYKENPNVVNEGAQAQAREALKKYLFYFERVSSGCYMNLCLSHKGLVIDESLFEHLTKTGFSV